MTLALLALAFLSDVPHTFSYVAEPSVQRVSVAGTFNAWNRTASPLTRGADGRTWSTTLDLPIGRHAYKFVLDGETWVADPKAKLSEADGAGNVNSVIVVTPPDYDTPARLGDGRITASALRHTQELPKLNYDRGRLHLTLRARPEDVQSVVLVTNRGRLPVLLSGADEVYATYRAEVPWDRKTDLTYAFKLNDGPTERWFGPDGLGEESGVGRFRIDAKAFKPFTPPTWVERSVLYQIFPDRFANGDPSNDPAGTVAWTAEPTWFSWFGGDLAGVRQRLGHLTGLGVGAVYFNPVFQGPSNHRYETSDYRLIDRRLGTNDQFRDLVAEMRRNGVRTVLDGVFNHVAVDYPPFADLLANQRQSKFRDWFFVKSWPVAVRQNPPYEAWFGFESMPKVNLDNPEARESMLSVVDFWAETVGVDGWRLDVANEVSMDFWRVFRPRVKAHGEDTWILGENWTDSSPWLKGDQWDSTMNYLFRGAVLDFVARDRLTPTAFWRRLMQTYDAYGPQVSRNAMNLLGSHDTPRILTECRGDGRLARLAAMVQFTWVGAPVVYYGDELGMEGGADPQNRRGMRWDKATPDNEFLSLYRRLGQARRASRPLQSGDPLFLDANDGEGWLAFARVLGNESTIVVVNRSERAMEVRFEVPDGVRPPKRRGQPLPVLHDVLNGGTARVDGEEVVARVPALGVAVLERAPLSTSVSTRHDGPPALANSPRRGALAATRAESSPDLIPYPSFR